MLIDLTPLKVNDKEFEVITQNVNKRYQGAWDDLVHESYFRYVKTIEDYSQRVHAVKCRAESLQREIESLKIDEMLEKAQHLCREAEAI